MKIKTLFLTIFIVIYLSSCSTTQKITISEISVENEVPNKTEIQNEISKTVDSLSLNTYPANNSFLISAVTPKFLYEDEEIQFALASAARQVSIYYGAYISYKKLIDENIIGTVQAEQVEVVFDQDLALSLLDKLEIIEEIRDIDYYMALIKMDGVNLPDYPFIEMNPHMKPTWINNPPNLDGYVIGVGVSGRRKSIYESWEQADKLAMAEIANSINTNITSGTATIERGGESSGVSTSVFKSLTVSDVNIKGLYILSRWREPDSSYYYSLAITRKQ